MKDQYAKIKRLFEYYYYKTYRAFPYYNSELNKVKIDNFLKQLSKKVDLSSIGNGFWIEYFAWSFSRRANETTKRNISFNWIIGKKMLDQWFDRKEKFSYQYDQFIKEHSIDIEQLRSDLVEPEKPLDKLDPLEEKEKGRLGGEPQLYNCLQFTTLYNSRSIICLTCSNKVLCKKLLAEKYPKIYEKRGYAVK